jgi:hypothetical protein
MHGAWLNPEAVPKYRTTVHQLLVDKWIEATGSVPA